jgi:hypothetical protein
MSDMQIELKGRIVKTAGSTAGLDVNIGNQHQVIEWKENEEVAQPFVRTIQAAIAGGQLPNPFAIAINVYAKKTPDKGAAIITLESMEVRAGSAKVASRAH